MKRKHSTPDLLATLILALLLLAAVMLLAGCGGTFALRPDGTVTYTTPEILKAPIVHSSK